MLSDNYTYYTQTLESSNNIAFYDQLKGKFTLRGPKALVACNPKLLNSTIGVKSVLYRRCKPSTANMVGTLCFCRSDSYTFR